MSNASFADMHMAGFEVDRSKYAMNPLASGKILDVQLDTKKAYRVRLAYWVKTASTDATGVKVNFGACAAAGTPAYSDAASKTIASGLAATINSYGAVGSTIATTEITLAAGERLVGFLVTTGNDAAVSAVGLVGRIWIEAIALV